MCAGKNDMVLQFNHLTVRQGLPQNSVFSIVKDKYGFMWFGTWGGAVRFDGYTMVVFRANADDSTALSDNRIESIGTDSLQNVWIQTHNTRYVHRYNYTQENFVRYNVEALPPHDRIIVRELPGNAQTRIITKGYEWTATPHGLIQRNMHTQFTKTYLPDRNNPFAISDLSVRNVYIDNHHVLWSGTQSGGVNFASLYPKSFDVYLSDAMGKGLVESAVRAIAVDHRNRIWVGSESQGVTIIDPQGSTPTFQYLGSESLSNTEIRALLCDKKGRMWIGTKNGLFVYHPILGNVTKGSPITMCHRAVFALHEDRQGNIWVGTMYGLAKYHVDRDVFECFDHSVTNGMKIRDIIEDRQGNFWIATEDKGVAKLTKTSNKGEKITFRSVFYESLSNVHSSLVFNRTFQLAEDTLGQIWIATDGGLSMFQPNENRFVNFTTSNGLPSDNIMGVLYDGHESVWISHKKGLTKMNFTTFTKRHFNVGDGLQGYDFSQSVSYRNNASGQLFFGGTNGLNAFFPQQIQVNPHPPTVSFTRLNILQQDIKPGMKLDGKVILEQSIQHTETLTLSHRHAHFQIEFAALHFANPMGNRYKYQLEGFDTKWIETNASQRIARYTHLSPGKYQLKVLAANSDGVWSQMPAVMNIVILPPWWLSGWAWLVYGLITCVLARLIYVFVRTKIKIKNAEEVHKAKLNFFTKISHEFRTPISLIIDPIERLRNNTLTKEQTEQYYNIVHRNALQLLTLINQLLDFRKLESEKLHLSLQTVNLVSLVRSVSASFTLMAEQRNIKFSTSIYTEKLTVRTDSEKLTMILNNLLSNAFKFTPDNGEVSVKITRAKQSNTHFVIEVNDNGVGIPLDEQANIFGMFYQSKKTKTTYAGSGVGLTLTHELVRLLQGHIHLKSEVNKGSSFTVTLPIGPLSENHSLSSELVAECENQQLVDNPTATDLELNQNQPLLLIVDDNPEIRDYIAMIFADQYTVLKAENGKEGWTIATEAIPDIIISDVRMPFMDGFELCEQLKCNVRTSHIPIILLTASHSVESKIQGYETGADAYLEKPFHHMVIRSLVTNLSEQRRRLSELFSKGTRLEMRKIPINTTDESFLNELVKWVEENMDTTENDMLSVAAKFHMSRSQLYRKIKAITNQSYNEFITVVRMNKALEYLQSGTYNVSETAYKVGYSAPTNFTRAFLKHFGVAPSHYSNVSSKIE